MGDVQSWNPQTHVQCEDCGHIYHKKGIHSHLNTKSCAINKTLNPVNVERLQRRKAMMSRGKHPTTLIFINALKKRDLLDLVGAEEASTEYMTLDEEPWYRWYTEWWVYTWVCDLYKKCLDERKQPNPIYDKLTTLQNLPSVEREAQIGMYILESVQL